MAQAREGGIDAGFLEELRDRTPLVALIGRTVPLKRSGGNHTGCCPLHGEKTPSFVVYKSHFTCYGCGERGDAVDFVRKTEGLRFTEAVARLAAEAGMEMPGKQGRAATPEEKLSHAQRMAENVRKMEARKIVEAAELAAHEAKIARRAEQVWARAKPAPADHPYLVRKQVEAHGARVTKDGRLLIPRTDEHGKLWNLETIKPDGQKKTLWLKDQNGEAKGGRTKGLYEVLGELSGAKAITFEEGRATGSSVHEATGLPAVIVFSGNNFEAVARILREKHPGVPFLIATDNDHAKERLDPPKENVGLRKAEAVAKAVPDTYVVAPTFTADDPGKDWNDVHVTRGRAAVKAPFDEALARIALRMETKMQTPPDPAQVEEKAPAPVEAKPPTGAEPPVAAKLGLADVVSGMALGAETLSAGDPVLRDRITRLGREAEDNPALLDDPWFRTRVAYAVQDAERATKAPVEMPSAERADLDRKAVASPGLQDAELGALLAATPGLKVEDAELLRDIRRTARKSVTGEVSENPAEFALMVDDLKRRTDSALVGGATPAPERASEVPSGPAPQAPQAPQASQTSQAPPEQPAEARPQSYAQPAQEGLTQGMQGSKQVQGPGYPVSRVGNALAGILGALRNPDPATPPPWQQPPAPLGDRLSRYEQNRANYATDQLTLQAEKAAASATRALEGLGQGPGSAVLGKIKEAAKAEPDGMQGVLSQMHPDGKYADLRAAFNAALSEERSFATAFDKAVRGVEQYGLARASVVDNAVARRTDLSQTDKHFAEADKAIGDASASLPGRKAGKSMQEELAEKAAEFFAKLVERVRAMLKAETPKPEAPAPAPAQKTPAPSMSI